MSCKPSSIQIGEVVVQQDSDGRFSLNDFHRASGGETRHAPALFFRHAGTKELVEEIQSGDSHSAPVETINGGPERGTYVCRELVYVYASWVSPAFHLKVLRVFDAYAQGYLTPAAPVRALPSPTEEKVAAHFRVLELLSRVPGVRQGIATTMALDAIHTDTGLTVEPYRKALPPGEGPAAILNATAVGEALGVSAVKANRCLAERGLQRQVEQQRDGKMVKRWELTETGKPYAEALPFTKNGHSDYQILWRPEVLDLLREERPAANP